MKRSEMVELMALTIAKQAINSGNHDIDISWINVDALLNEMEKVASQVETKLNADIATEHIAGVLEELSKSVFQGNHEQDFLWRARIIVSSLEDLGIEVEYDTDVSSKIDEQVPTPKKLSLRDSFTLYLADFKARMNK